MGKKRKERRGDMCEEDEERGQVDGRGKGRKRNKCDGGGEGEEGWGELVRRKLKTRKQTYWRERGGEGMG